MIKLYDTAVWLLDGKTVIPDNAEGRARLAQRFGRLPDREEARRATIAAGILAAHGREEDGALRLRFDSLTSHDITYVGILQTARASGFERCPMPYVLTNCHNSLCAVGGTINEDDHAFAVSAAEKYGCVYVPPHLAVIHSYNRERMAGGGRMILGSDSHTRYGALGTLGVGEGGGELAKQLLGRTYDIASPQVTAVFLTGAPRDGVGPQDVALQIIKAVFRSGYVKNKVMEFVGDGVGKLSMDYRFGIDVMTTETACWSSVWATDARVEEWLALHGRPEAHRALAPGAVACYDGMAYVDLSEIEPSIALPFHPSNVFTLRELKANAGDILSEAEKNAARTLGPDAPRLRLTDKIGPEGIRVQQGVIAGCSGGTFENLTAAADILAGKGTGIPFSLYPGSQPIYAELIRCGAASALMDAGCVLRSAFCGPCFGAGDTPANGALSIRHTTRNFPCREGCRPGEGQMCAVALMDARSIAATAANGGVLTGADELGWREKPVAYHYDSAIYARRVLDCTGRADPAVPLVYGPNIKDWPEMPALPRHLLLAVVSRISDPVTTTDELIPSGETSSYRSNPLRLAEFTLSRRDPGYVARAKAVQGWEQARERGETAPEFAGALERIRALPDFGEADAREIGVGSAVCAEKPGDGSAREQAASCQRVLGGWANIAAEYATKRYRSNLINWGLLPFLCGETGRLEQGDLLLIPDALEKLKSGADRFEATVLGKGEILLTLGALTDQERQILADGCLINYYREENRHGH